MFRAASWLVGAAAAAVLLTTATAFLSQHAHPVSHPTTSAAASTRQRRGAAAAPNFAKHAHHLQHPSPAAPLHQQHPHLSAEAAADVLDVVFPHDGATSTATGSTPKYSERVRVGREAQGYMQQSSGEDDLFATALSSSSVAGELTYGEFSWPFVSDAVDVCLERRLAAAESGGGRGSGGGGGGGVSDLTFLDVGSGVGRLVIGQALRHPWRECVGVEVVPELHAMAVAALDDATTAATAIDSRRFTEGQRAALRGMAPCSLVLGDVLERGGAAAAALARADVVFCYCSTWPAYGDVLTGLSFALGTTLRAGAVVVTTDRRLASEPGVWEFEAVRTLTAFNSETGGESTAYVWELTRSGAGVV